MFLYNFSIYILQFAFQCGAFIKPKAKLFIDGRKNWKYILQQQLDSKKIVSPIWMHCASLGEFEQGRPVIEAIKQKHPAQHIILTFFSPSGFENQKEYRYADIVCYLPIDTKANAHDFVRMIQPKFVLFVKYEFWLNYLFALQKEKTPCYLISTVIKKHQPFFKWYGSVFRKGLQTYDTIFTQDEESLKLLNQLNVHTGKLAGDTRFDRVLQIGSAPKKIPDIATFTNNAFTIIAGSTWQKDEELLLNSYIELTLKHPQLKLIIAPHEIDRRNIERLKNLLFHKKLSYHLFTEEATSYEHPVLIVNTIGLLSSIYQYGQIAYIGGGFDNGIHNILEAMVYGLPVFFGPNHHKYNEAKTTIKLEAAFEINNQPELTEKLEQLISSPEFLRTASNKATAYITSNAGATHIIVKTVLIKNKLVYDEQTV